MPDLELCNFDHRDFSGEAMGVEAEAASRSAAALLGPPLLPHVLNDLRLAALESNAYSRSRIAAEDDL